jgi:glycosyltransferase involved in cell wall biosynthesis
MDLIVESFGMMPDKKLIVIGDGPDFNKVKEKASTNVEILGYQNTEKLIQYMQQAKALIFAAEEDFGLVPLEAQACGTPVIAYGKGGALETVRGLDQSKPTGLFFKNQTAADICKAVVEFENNYAAFSIENCTENAKQFSPEIFKNKILKFVADATSRLVEDASFPL